MNTRQITHAIKNWVSTEVSTVSPFNADNSYLILLGSNPGSILDHFILCDGDGVFEKDLPIAASQEPRWSHSELERLYFLEPERSTIASLKVGMPGTIFTEHVFTEYTKISGKGESDISLDGEHFALCGTRSDGALDVFVYNLVTNTKEHLISNVLPFDGLKISSNNEWILSRETDPRDPVNDGIFTPHGRLLAFNGHACPARYKGSDILLWCNSLESPVTRPNCPNGVIMVTLDGGYQIGLHSFPWDYAFHISSCDRDYCVISPYSKINPTLPMQIWLTPFDGSAEMLLVADTGGVYRDYTSQPKAALSRDGTKAVYTVDDGTNVNVWMVEIETPTVQPIVTEPIETRIDYGPYYGKSEFSIKFRTGSELMLKPRLDGGVDLTGVADIFERKL